MSPNIKKFLFGFGLIVLFALAYFSSPFVLPVLFGSVLANGIFGKVSGKTGGVVFGDWKGINYARSYVETNSSNSAGQQTQRTKFGIAIDLARQILGAVAQPYWDPFTVKKSGFNAMVSEFLLTMDGTNKLVIATKLAKGTLETLGTLTATYNTSNGAVNVSWSNTAPTGNGMTTDTLFHVCYDKSTQLFYYFQGIQDRTAGSEGDWTMPTGLTATNLIFYAFAIQGSGSEMIVSDSSSDVAAAP